MGSAILGADAAVRVWFASHHAPALDWVMLALTAIGRAGSIWLLLGVLLAFKRPVTAAGVLQMALAILIAGQLTDRVLKPAVGRVRPFVAVMDVRVVGDRPGTYSFPSGHAATAFAGAYGLSRIWRRMRPAWWLLAIGIALSRVYLGVHYPLDILAGALVGATSAWFAIGGTPVQFPADLRET
jgi:undecaprenyl-diphosphatase